jgi:hypothetical protein
MQKGSARPVNRTRVVTIQINEMLGVAALAPSWGDQTLPTTPDADDIIPKPRRPIGHGLDHCVETGNISATRQNSNFLLSHAAPNSLDPD